jgi:enoyl-CoA hydratase/carnithine racemase
MSEQHPIGPFQTLRYEDLGDGIGLLELHRPERRNAWTVRMAAELHDALTAIDADADVRVLIITGAGDTFSVGADLGSGSLMTPGGETLDSPRRPLMPSDMQIPVIAALNGHAAGAGISFAMHCDIRILADSAKVAFAFVRRGVIPEMGLHWLLPRMTGMAVATGLILTGRTITAEEALAAGVVHTVLPASDVLPAAIETAREMVRTTSPLGLSFAKQLLWSSLHQTQEVAWDHELAAFVQCAEHPDAAEGVTAFLERRQPTWTGRRQPTGATTRRNEA